MPEWSSWSLTPHRTIILKLTLKYAPQTHFPTFRFSFNSISPLLLPRPPSLLFHPIPLMTLLPPLTHLLCGIFFRFCSFSFSCPCTPSLRLTLTYPPPQMFKQHNVTHVVRVCDPTYSIETIEAAGIVVHVRALAPPLWVQLPERNASVIHPSILYRPVVHLHPLTPTPDISIALRPNFFHLPLTFFFTFPIPFFGFRISIPFHSDFFFNSNSQPILALKKNN